MDNPLTVITNFGDWKSRKGQVKGVVKRDWVPGWAHRFRHQTQWQ
jgi:hypothetical protein